MRKDKTGVLHGKCSDRDEYETTDTVSILCEYCGHRPVEHEIIRSTDKATPAKKPRLETTEEASEIDLGNGEVQIEITDDEPIPITSSPSLNPGETLQPVNIAESLSQPSRTKNDLVSPYGATPEQHMEVVEVPVDVDPEMKVQ